VVFWSYRKPTDTSYPEQALSANHGQVIAIKDNIATRSLPVTCSSEILRGYNAPEDATVVRLLKQAGMLVLAKTNMDEFGMGSHTTHSAFGPVMNGSHSNAISVGGSSGGSAFAVAADLVKFALGTDTGGSVRLPAAYTSLVGFKPSYGLVSRNGVIPYANSLDTVGIIAKSCMDVFLLFQTLNEHDPEDPTSLTPASRRRIQFARRERLARVTPGAIHVVPSNAEQHLWRELRDYQLRKKRRYQELAQLPRTRRIGVPIEYNIAELHSSVRDAWMLTLSMLQSNGHEIVPISLPSTKQALSAYYVIAPAEASSNLAKYDGVRYGAKRPDEFDNTSDGVLYAKYRGDHFGEEVKRRILLGAYSLSAGAIDNYFIQAQKIRRIVQNDFNLVFNMSHPLQSDSQPASQGVDLIVCPTAPTPPPSLKSLENATPVEGYTNDVFTVPASLAGLPAISVPAPPAGNTVVTPDRAIGIQIIGQYGDDYDVIQFAKREFEERISWDSFRRLKIGKVLR